MSNSSMVRQIRNKISVPKYFKMFIDSNIDLDTNPSICCPFHEEDTPSFSYSRDRKIWRCWGACKVGGDVIDLNRKHHKLKTREESVNMLVEILGIETGGLDLSPIVYDVDPNQVEYGAKMNQATKLAKTVDDYIELDYLMSQHKPTSDLKDDLEMFINSKIGR